MRRRTRFTLSAHRIAIGKSQHRDPFEKKKISFLAGVCRSRREKHTSAAEGFRRDWAHDVPLGAPLGGGGCGLGGGWGGGGGGGGGGGWGVWVGVLLCVGLLRGTCLSFEMLLPLLVKKKKKRG